MRKDLFAKLRSRLVNTHPQNNVLRLLEMYDRREVEPTAERVTYDGSFNVNSLTEAFFALMGLTDELAQEVERLQGRPVDMELKTMPPLKDTVLAAIEELIAEGAWTPLVVKTCQCESEEADATVEPPAEQPPSNLVDMAAAPTEETPAPAPAPKKQSKKKGDK